MWVIPEPTGLVSDVIEKQRAPSAFFRAVLIVGAVLTLLGIIGFVLRLAADGFSDHTDWGFYVAAFAFVFTLTSSAPLAACAFRFTKSHWRRPLSRIAELFSLVSIVNILLFIPALIALPDIPEPAGGQQRSPRHSPHHLVPGAHRRAGWLAAVGNGGPGGLFPGHPVGWPQCPIWRRAAPR